MNQHLETDGRDAYLAPAARIILLRLELSVLSDDDNTGGTGYDMPWDD